MSAQIGKIFKKKNIKKNENFALKHPKYMFMARNLFSLMEHGVNFGIFDIILFHNTVKFKGFVYHFSYETGCGEI